MLSSRRVVAVIGGLAIAAGATLAAAPTADAATACPPAPAALGTASLASVLLADKSGFDHNGRDYDVLTAAVLAVLKAKPNSPVKVLTDGNVALTAFLPNDYAFERLVKDLTGTWKDEQGTFTAVAGLGIDTVETVLLYHVVAGATIDAKTALKSNGAVLTTAQGGTITVKVRWGSIRLVDKDPNSRDPRVNAPNINVGNKQIAHGIDRVLRPLDLP